MPPFGVAPAKAPCSTPRQNRILSPFVLKNISGAETIVSNGQIARISAQHRCSCSAAPEIKTIVPIDREQSNSSVIVDSKYVVKVLRRVTAGIHPEFEMGRYLADVAHFQNSPALLGTVELVEGESRTALCAVHAFTENQGDAWALPAPHWTV